MAEPRLAAVTVTYQPDIDVLRQQVSGLSRISARIWVDNASSPHLRVALRELAKQNDVTLLENEHNWGLAAALNLGAARARTLGCDYLLLLDQDTEPGADGAQALFEVFRREEARDPGIGCIGPRLVDVATGLEHGFHQISGYRWVRRFNRQGDPLRVANLNGSGLLMRSDLFERLDGLREDFFIDHVDTEWAFRVTRKGRSLLGVPTVAFRHRMGVTGLRYWLFSWRVWPYRTPLRHFYLFRNTVTLLRSDDAPLVWKIWAPVKLLITVVLHAVFDPARRAQCIQMLRGVRAGMQTDANRSQARTGAFDAD
jgi:rhamnosyltransferase